MAGLVLVLVVLGGIAACACAASGGHGESDVRYISSFSGPSDVAAFRVTGARAQWSRGTEDGAMIEGTAFETTVVREGAMHLALVPGKQFATVEYDAGAGMPSDWSGYDRFVMHFENGSEFMINLWLTVTDASGASVTADNLWIVRSKNNVDFPLAELRTKDGKSLDLKHVKSIRLEIRSAEKFERDLWLFRFRLEKSGAPVIAASDRTMLIDFAPLGASFTPGARQVHEKTAYAKWRGYGWTEGTPALTSVNFRKPGGLTVNWVYADLAAGKATLRVDMPDGRYSARFYGGNYNEKVIAVKSFALAVNGKKVAEKAVDPKTYYTTAGHFFGLDKWYARDEDPYDVYVAPFYQMHDFDFEVKGGKAEFTWTGTLGAFGLLIAPTGDEFHNASDAVEKARRDALHANVVFPKPPSEKLSADEVEAERGFVLWSRNWIKNVGLYDRPAEHERAPKVFRVKAARGERAHIAFTATPLRDLGGLKVQVSHLQGDSRGRVPSGAVEIRTVRYMWEDWPAQVKPAFLYPSAESPAQEGINRTFWLTITVPDDAEGGIYRGSVRISAKDGGEIELPIELEARPFSLIENHIVSYAWWRTSDYNMNYMLRYFLPEKMDYLRRLLDAEAANMKAHGCTAFYFNVPIIKGVQGEKVILDFSILEEEAAAARKYGFCDKARPGMVFLLPDIARYLMKETRYGDYLEPEDVSPALPESERVEEFSDLFNARYVDAARQIHAFFEGKGLSVLLYTVDEPRERNTNRWNRNLADTLRYSELVRKGVPGARIYVDPMRDENSGVDYLPILDVVDVIGTHPWDQSERIIKRAANEALPALWYFNSIVWDRYDFGFEVDVADAKGFWQWHYQWEWVPFQPFHPGFKWGVTIPGPDGPYDKSPYEMVATAINDYRYIATLQQRIEQARFHGDAANSVTSAENSLALFYDNAPPYPSRPDYADVPRAERRKRDIIAGKSLDQWRDVFAEHIIEIDAELAPLP